ncbi:MAG: metallopeptidase TldD-related protein [bacterium]
MQDNNRAQKLLEQLELKIKKVQNIKGYILFLSVARDSQAGFLNQELGNIYRPVQTNDSLKGSFYFEYDDNKYSSGNLNISAWNDFELFMKSSQLSAFTDENPVTIPGLVEYKKPQLCDDELKNLVLNNPEKLLDLVSEFKDKHSPYKSINIEGNGSIGYYQSAITTSEGFRNSSDSTTLGLSAEYNMGVFFYQESRKLFDVKELDKKIEVYTNYANILSSDKKSIPSGEYTVLLEPDATYPFLNKFILENINGNFVDAGTTRFSKDDFVTHKNIFNEDLNIRINQVEDYLIESFSFDSEGVLPRDFNLIENGSLQSPICDLKSGKKLGFTSCHFSSLRYTEITSNRMESYEKFLQSHNRFILIFSFLGIHTQNKVLGKYSLPAPHAVFVENGEIIAPINCVISGDAFEKFLSDDFYFVQTDYQNYPSLTFKTEVTIV